MVLKLTFTNGNTAASIQINKAAVKYLNGTAFSKTISSKDSITVRYDGSKYIYDEIELATMNNPGTVKLGASKVAGLITTPSAQTVTGRYYPVQTDNNNRLVVNVPWDDNTDTHYTAEVVVGGNNATANASSQTDPYIRVLDKNGSNVIKDSDVQLKGAGLVSISSADNVITVSASHPDGNHIPSGGSSGKILRWNSSGTAKWDDETTYDTLDASHRSITNSFLVAGPGATKSNAGTYFLNANGSWTTIAATVSKLQDAGDNSVGGSTTGSSAATGQLKVSSPQPIKMLKVSAYHKAGGNPEKVVFFGDGQPHNEITIEVSNINIHRFSQTSDIEWIVQVEAIGGNVYVAPIYYRFYDSSSTWKAAAL